MRQFKFRRDPTAVIIMGREQQKTGATPDLAIHAVSMARYSAPREVRPWLMFRLSAEPG